MKRYDQKFIVSLVGGFLLVTLASGTQTLAASQEDERPEPTVADCVKKTGNTEEKCSEMIEKMKNMTDEERMKMRPGNGEGRPANGIEKPVSRPKGEARTINNKDSLLEKVKRIRTEREASFTRVEEGLDRIVEYLSSKNIDIEELTANVDTYKAKVEEVLAAFDAYIEAIEESDTDQVEADSFAENRNEIKKLMQELMSYYRTTLRESLKSAVRSLTED